MQAAGESALASYGLPGAFVTMNVNNGQILGMGSSPTFDPTVFTGPMTQSQVNELYRDPVPAPLSDRATESYYPTGSTFKIITALAALEGGEITPSTSINDGGTITVGDQSFQNAGGASFGPVDLVPALEVSSDVYFYTGLDMWDTNQLQNWAGKLGIGKESGLDLPGETEGLVPSRSGATSSTRKATPTGPGRPATTSSWRSARATCRPTRCRWRSPTRRSATTARSSPRTWAWKSRTRPAGC